MAQLFSSYYHDHHPSKAPTSTRQKRGQNIARINQVQVQQNLHGFINHIFKIPLLFADMKKTIHHRSCSEEMVGLNGEIFRPLSVNVCLLWAPAKWKSEQDTFLGECKSGDQWNKTQEGQSASRFSQKNLL